MNALRRAIGRKEVVLGMLLMLIGGGWFGWKVLVHQVVAQVEPNADPQSQDGGVSLAAQSSLADLGSMLDAGQYSQAAARADVLLDQGGSGAGIRRYKMLAQLLAGDAPAAAASGDRVLATSTVGPDAAVALAIKGLVLTDYEHQRPAEAQPLAQQALQQAGTDPDARLLASVAYAAAVRGGLDGVDQPAAVAQQASLIQQTLNPVIAAVPTQPNSGWRARFWRQGLALLADSQMLAGSAGEPAAMSVLRQSCPPDAWACYFSIPDKALQVAHSSSETIDDHGRVAMLTAVGFLYTDVGDRLHGDAAFRRAIQAYSRLLEDYDGWAGEVKDTITPRGRSKKVGEEFYTYRNRMERLAKYSADWWGIRVLDGRARLDEAIAQCDSHLFRAIVRVRADRQTDAIVILQQERIRESDYSTVADWFAKRPHAPQADWELERAALIGHIGDEEVLAVKSIAQARGLMVKKKHDEALGLLGKSLQTEPSLAETGVSLRCEVASVLMDQQRYEEAAGMLEDADQVLQAGDSRLTSHSIGELQGRIGYYHTQCARATKNYPQAIQFAEQAVLGAGIPMDLRARMLLDLIEMHVDASDRPQALDAYNRLLGLPVTPAESQAFLKAYLHVARVRLGQKGWYEASPASQPG